MTDCRQVGHDEMSQTVAADQTRRLLVVVSASGLSRMRDSAFQHGNDAMLSSLSSDDYARCEGLLKQAGLLDPNFFDFIQCYIVAGAVVEFRRAGRFVGSDRLSVFNRTTILQIGGDAGRPKRVTTNFLG